MLAKPFWSALLVLSPALTLAQSAAPRFYLGASAELMQFYPFSNYYDGFSYVRTRVGPAATVGLRLNAHWAVESGAQVAWHNEAQESSYITQGGYLAFERYSSHLRTLVVPLWVRYTATRATSSLHVDVLGGGSWLHFVSNGTYSSSISGSTTTNNSDYGYTDNYFCVGLGPQLRYSLGQRVDLKFNVPLNLRLVPDHTAYFYDRLFFTPQLGVQYTFGG